MKRFLLFLLLTSIAFCQCGELLSQLESDNYEYLTIQSIDCDSQDTENVYAQLSALGEGYAQVAQCYDEQDFFAKSEAYYSLSGEKYRLAADALCATDPSLKMQLYISSGDSYQLANQGELAKFSYDLAIYTFGRFSDSIDSTLYSKVESKLFELNSPLEHGVVRGGSHEYFDFMPWAIGGVILMGIIIFILTLGKIK